MYCSIPSLSGHSTEATLSNMAINLLVSMYLLLPLATGHLSNVTTVSWQIGWPY